VVYQLLRTAMVDATNTRPGIDPDRVGTVKLDRLDIEPHLAHRAGVHAVRKAHDLTDCG
jgi:hypothetical protein